MSKKNNLPGETNAVRVLRARIRERETALARAIAVAEEMKLELLSVQREYEARVEPLAREVALLDDKIFELKKVRDLILKGETLASARRIVRERDRQRVERERGDSERESGTGNRESEVTKIKESATASPELKKLWRALAYRFHPDLTQDTEEKGERESMMKRVNDAYQRGDLALLHELADGGKETMKEHVNLCESDLREALLDLDESLRRVTQRLDAFKRSPWQKVRAMMRKGKREHRDYFKELETEQMVEVAARKKLIARIEKELVQVDAEFKDISTVMA